MSDRLRAEMDRVGNMDPRLNDDLFVKQRPDTWMAGSIMTPAHPGVSLLAFIGLFLSLASAQAQPTLHKEVYGVGILGNCCTHGAGVCGAFQTREEFQVVAAYEPNPRRAKELAQTWGDNLASSYDEVINHPDVDIVAITCDPADKPAMVEKAAAVGKHIYLNKPPCSSLDGARQIVQAVKKHQVWLVHDIPMVRSVPVLARLLEEVHSGKHGKVIGYHHHFGMNFDPAFDLKAAWPERLDLASKSGGGEMTNMGCYAIDYVVSLLGSPKKVTAKWRKDWDVYRDADVENFGQIILDYGDFYAVLDVGKQQLNGPRAGVANRMSINFQHETLMIDASAHFISINHQPIRWEDYTKNATAVGSLDQLLQALRDGTSPSSGVENIVPSTEVLMAAYRSILEQRPITLPLESGENPLV
ncbi:MAG: Gfo/Idh/MocA family protein, partial [Pirellulaceae bacterium]